VVKVNNKLKHITYVVLVQTTPLQVKTMDYHQLKRPNIFLFFIFFIKHESKVPIDAARRIVKEEIVEEKKVNYDNVRIVDRVPSSCIYVPKWVINIESQNAVYTREILAASNTILMNEIAYCPHEFFARFRPSRKETYALCERCGGAYCSRHIQRVNESYFCKEHR
jgi:hypothetical protein